MNRPLRVFLSHASEDKSAVRALRKVLADKNVDVWLDEERILPGQSWENEIRKGLEEADVVIVCLSKNLVNKEGYIHRELRMALRKAEEKPEDTIYLIPVKLEECDAPSSFEHLQWANLFFNNGIFDGSILNRIMISLKKRAESLGLLWASLSSERDSSATDAPEKGYQEERQPKAPPKTISIETESPRARTESQVTVKDRVTETPIILSQSRGQDLATTTRSNAALILYLIDTSGTMGKMLKGKTRLEFVRSALNEAIGEMAFRSSQIKNGPSNYRVGIYTYSDKVVNVLGGIKAIDELATAGVPKFQLMNKTDTALAFAEMEKLLRQELPDLQDAPAPLICHITDGKFTGDHPVPIAKKIMGMTVKQGNVLIENLYICDDMLIEPISDFKEWAGVSKISELQNEYAQSLFEISSPLPASYHGVLTQNGYRISKSARMLFPGECAREFTKLLLPG